jgi:membrane peptidoglycan carboxypeptidase
VLALVGGRNYSLSQLNHAVAERPTGSIFKPFVYATAYNTSLNGTTLDGGGVFTALTGSTTTRRTSAPTASLHPQQLQEGRVPRHGHRR